MNIAGKEKREYLYNNYTIKVVGCIKVFGRSFVNGDAGGPKITDKYYQFSCTAITPMISPKTDLITCGYTTAKEICERMNLIMPRCFNPFDENTEGEAGGGNGQISQHNNRISLQLYNAAMILITSQQDKLSPGSPIFVVTNRIISNLQNAPENRDIKALSTIYSGFKTTVFQEIQKLKKQKETRRFVFDDLLRYSERNDIPHNFLL